jgi:hypothetical protein
MVCTLNPARLRDLEHLTARGGGPSATQRTDLRRGNKKKGAGAWSKPPGDREGPELLYSVAADERLPIPDAGPQIWIGEICAYPRGLLNSTVYTDAKPSVPHRLRATPRNHAALRQSNKGMCVVGK